MSTFTYGELMGLGADTTPVAPPKTSIAAGVAAQQEAFARTRALEAQAEAARVGMVLPPKAVPSGLTLEKATPWLLGIGGVLLAGGIGYLLLSPGEKASSPAPAVKSNPPRRRRRRARRA